LSPEHPDGTEHDQKDDHEKGEATQTDKLPFSWQIMDYDGREKEGAVTDEEDEVRDVSLPPVLVPAEETGIIEQALDADGEKRANDGWNNAAQNRLKFRFSFFVAQILVGDVGFIEQVIRIVQPIPVPLHKPCPLGLRRGFEHKAGGDAQDHEHQADFDVVADQDLKGAVARRGRAPDRGAGNGVDDGVPSLIKDIHDPKSETAQQNAPLLLTDKNSDESEHGDEDGDDVPLEPAEILQILLKRRGIG